MEGLVEVTLKKVHILSILNYYYKLFPLVYIGFDSEGITIQGNPVRNKEFWLLRLFPETLLRVVNVESLRL